MESKSEKFNYVLAQINSFNNLGSDVAKKIVKDRLKYYEPRKDNIEALPWSQIKGHDFHYEIEQRINVERKKIILKNRVQKLERHAYAPELNTLWFKSGKCRIVHDAKTIKDAILKVISDGISLQDCQKI